MDLIIKKIIDKKEKEMISKEVLYDLPEWFGLPESTKEYIKDSQDKPFLACYADNEVAGFIVLNATSKDTADIFVMGIKKKFHRMGIGTKLNTEFENMAKNLGYSYSQVKTVKMGHYKEYECFPTLWDEWNPCQIYIKYLGE